MTLGAKRELFARLHPRLVLEAHRQGYDVMLDELKRGPEQAEYNATHCGTCRQTKRQHVDADHDFHAIGIRNTVHGVGLAQDIILRRNGRPLWARKHYLSLGLYWESLHALCRWGGRFRGRGDAGHFSLAHRGKA